MPVPSLGEFLLESPLYQHVQLEDSDEATVSCWLGLAYKFDGYCLRCDDRTVFLDSRTHRHTPHDALADRSIIFEAKCVRCSSQSLRFYLEIEDRRLFKVGQYPSHADLSNPELRKYRKILGREKAADLHRAIGLAAHGVGVGSYAYLRRIFEELLEDHRGNLEQSGQVIEGYDRLRIDEKIQALQGVLPSALVENRAIYGILSRGIHELNEDQCLALFPVIKDGIVMILEQDREQRERREREARLRNDLAKVAGMFETDN